MPLSVSTGRTAPAALCSPVSWDCSHTDLSSVSWPCPLCQLLSWSPPEAKEPEHSSPVQLFGSLWWVPVPSLRDTDSGFGGLFPGECPSLHSYCFPPLSPTRPVGHLQKPLSSNPNSPGHSSDRLWEQGFQALGELCLQWS